jgi:ubiquinone biosynthesis protein Coq4
MLDLPPEIPPHILKAVRGFIAFASNPNQTEAVFDMADGLRPTDLYQQFIEYAHSQPAVAQIIQERYFAPTADLEQLLNYPQGSLGYHYAAEMKRAGLQPGFYRNIAIEYDYSYIAMRMRQTHDVWHIITGFGTDLAGEVGLQAFSLAQLRSPLAVAIMAAAIAYSLKSSSPLSPLVESMQQGWEWGKMHIRSLLRSGKKAGKSHCLSGEPTSKLSLYRILSPCLSPKTFKGGREGERGRF